ncbi:hypothetical protein HDV00_004525, partial [Rhizophlyctis rosea]
MSKDLCLVTNGEPSTFLRLSTLPKPFGLELIESVLANHAALFKKVMECEIFLSMFCRLLEPEHAPYWQRILVMEVFKSICADANLLRSVFESYDANEHSTKVFQEMITGFAKIVVAERSSLLLHAPPPVNPEAGSSIPSGIQHESFALTVHVCIGVSIDQLDKSDPPSAPETYIIYLAIICLTNMADSQASFALPILQDSAASPNESGVLLAIEMANNSWANILAVLSFLVTASIDEDIFMTVIRAYQNFTSILGLLGLTAPRDAFLSSLCKVCIPATAEMGPGKEQGMGPPMLGRGHGLLNDRNVICLRALLHIAQTLTPVMEDRAWFGILETLQVSESLMSAGKLGRRDQSSIALLTDAATPQGEKKGQTVDNQFATLMLLIKKLFEDTAKMEDKNFMEFLRALCRLARESSSAPAAAAASSGKDSMKVAEEKSFAITKLHCVSLVNVQRLISSHDFAAWNLVIDELISISHSPQCTVSIRAQVCSAFNEIITSAMQFADLKQAGVEMTLLEPLKRLMYLEGGSSMGGGLVLGSGGTSDDGGKLARGQSTVDVQKAGLETLNKVLQTSGQNLSASWYLIFDAIRSVTDRKRTALKALDVKPGDVLLGEGEGAGTSTEAAPTSAKIGLLTRIAFPSLQLICTDFLTLLPPTVLHTCIEAIGSFGAQSDDLNISLTAVGLLWQVSDFVLTKRHELEQGGSLGDHLNEGPEPVDKESNDGLLASRSFTTEVGLSRARSSSLEALKGPITTRTMDTLWMLLLGHLSQLCSDPRPEVRNSANQTLFRTIGMNGQRLTLDAWNECIWSILFPLLERIKALTEKVDLIHKIGLVAGVSGESPATGSPVKNKVTSSPSASTPVHHSRDTVSKQWDETKVITLAGITKCFLDFLPVLVELGEGFERAWSLFLDYVKTWCLSGSPEVAMAAIKSLRTFVQYPKSIPGGEIPENVRRRVLELWRMAWEVWEGIGVGVVGNADENAGQETPGGRLMAAPVGTETKVLHGYFTQDCINAYAGIIPDLYEVIRPTFGLFELRRLLNVLAQLLLYHTNVQPGATISRIRADQINDLENPSSFQTSVLELITGNTIDVGNMKGAPELVIITVAGFVKLPFVRGGGQHPAVVVESPTTSEYKGFTYIALAKRAMQALGELYDKFGKLRTVYSSGAFEKTVEALGVPMRAKYDCPNPGSKDSTPLWKFAANTCMTVVGIGLTAMDDLVSELPQEISNTIYSRLLDTFEGFLLPAREPPSPLSAEELAADESFDISVLTSIESDILMHIGKPHVSEALIKRLVEIIRNGTKFYSTPLEQTPEPSSLAVSKLAETEALAMAKGASASFVNSKSLVNIAEEVGDAPISRRPSTLKRPTKALGSDVIPANLGPFRYRIAEVAAPILIDKCKEVLQDYAADRPLYGRMPFPRVREQEILFCLRRLQDLNLRPGILAKTLLDDKT